MGEAKRVLVVEDDDAIRTLLSDLLAEAGYDVQTARGGREALGRVERAEPDLILLDHVMPEGDGTEFARAYAKRKGRAPIIALCAARDGDVWARTIGAAAHIVKPFDIDALLATVAQHVG